MLDHRDQACLFRRGRSSNSQAAGDAAQALARIGTKGQIKNEDRAEDETNRFREEKNGPFCGIRYVGKLLADLAPWPW